jgi:hypothetical protein
MQQHRFARAALDAILVKPRTGRRGETPLLYGAEALEVVGACAWR